MNSKYYYFLYFFSIVLVFSCTHVNKKTESFNPFFKISLAQWSLNKMVKNGANPLDFPKEAKDLGFNAVELVSDFILRKLKKLALTTPLILLELIYLKIR